MCIGASPISQDKTSALFSLFSIPKLWAVFFLENNADFEGFVVLLNRKSWRSIHADYIVCNIARKMLMAKKQT